MRYWVTAESEDLAPYRGVLDKLEPEWMYEIKYQMFKPEQIHSVHTECIVTIDTTEQLMQMIEDIDQTNKGTWRFVQEGVRITGETYCHYDEDKDIERIFPILHIRDTYDK